MSGGPTGRSVAYAAPLSLADLQAGGKFAGPADDVYLDFIS